MMRACVIALHDLQYNSNLLDLAEVLARNGFEVDVYARFANSAVHARRGFRCTTIDDSDSNIKLAKNVLSHIEGRYDVFVGQNVSGLAICAFARALQRFGICVYYALELEDPISAIGISRLLARIRKYALRPTDFVITTGPERAQILSRWLRHPAHVLYNSPLRAPSAGGGPGRIRQALTRRGVPSDVPIVLYHGVLTRFVGIDTILEARRLWRSDAWLCIMGFGNVQLLEMVSRAAQDELGLLLLPPVSTARDELLTIVQDASVGLVLYRHKGPDAANVNLVYASPSKLMDFMACGVPVVCSDNPSLRCVESEGWGLCVDPDDPQGVARGVDEVLRNRAQRSTRAREVFERQYKYDIAANILVEAVIERLTVLGHGR